mmetsp:Transcript_36787/g.84306  ORF Transcript_36787/g.84306 Transcript_36787/m.84306 type:complete len:221 (+) Transcript_36787:2-664(+)
MRQNRWAWRRRWTSTRRRRPTGSSRPPRRRAPRLDRPPPTTATSSGTHGCGIASSCCGARLACRCSTRARWGSAGCSTRSSPPGSPRSSGRPSSCWGWCQRKRGLRRVPGRRSVCRRTLKPSLARRTPPSSAARATKRSRAAGRRPSSCSRASTRQAKLRALSSRGGCSPPRCSVSMSTRASSSGWGTSDTRKEGRCSTRCARPHCRRSACWRTATWRLR